MSDRLINIGQNRSLMEVRYKLFRHSDTMIKRLESAGLGFFVQATETQQKLGENNMNITL